MADEVKTAEGEEEADKTSQGQEQTPKTEDKKVEGEKKEAPKGIFTSKKGRSFGEILKEVKDEDEGKETKVEAKVEDKAKEADTKKDSHKQPANERIQGLIEKNKEFQTQLSDEQKSNKELEARLKSLEGKVDQKTVDKTKAEAKKEEVVDYAKVKEEMEDDGKTDKQIEIFITALKRGDEAEKRIKLLEERLEAKDDEEEDTKRKDFVKKNEKAYTEIAKEYKDYFNVPENGEMPEFKDPEMDKAAVTLSAKFNVPVYVEEGKDPVTVNPILTSKEGLQMFMYWLTREGRANEKAKKKVDEGENLKTKVVTQPSVNKSLKNKGKRNWNEILEETRQEMNM